MDKIAFNLEKYLKIQSENINKRIDMFGDKLYLEFGGKLFDDYHASRVLPGFIPDAKLKTLLELKDKVEIIVVVNATDINSNKVRNDTGYTYQDEVERLINSFRDASLYTSSVVLSFYTPSTLVKEFISKMTKRGVKVYKHYAINGYPSNIPLIVSEQGLGKNEYVETTRPLVVVTAPGPGSGKMATCLSQLYHDNKRNIRAGYAKYETFPIWNLPLKHPVNMAYEAATVDLLDVNMIDPFHLEAYGVMATNYNRDVEVFPLLKNIFEKIYGKSPYNSPTDMGVNMCGFAIDNEEVAIEASKDEIIRRYYQAKKNNFMGKYDDECVAKAELLMNQAGVTINDRKTVKLCLDTYKAKQTPICAIELNDGRLLTGKRSDSFSSPAAMILNALKVLAKIDDSLDLISSSVIEPIRKLKTEDLHHQNPRLHVEDILIALAIQAPTNSLSALALKQISKLQGCQVHASHILVNHDLSTLKKLGIDVTEEPITIKRNF